MAEASFEMDGHDVIVVNWDLGISVSGYVNIDEDNRSEGVMATNISVGGVDDTPMVVASGISIGI